MAKTRKIPKEESSLKYKARSTYAALRKVHPDARIELKFKNSFQLMVATILSAQCTDVMVNKVTGVLFKRFKTAKDFAAAPSGTIEEIIRPTGFFNQKAKSIRRCAELLVENHSGRVPCTMEELTKLPGVGRKTANVILGNAFGIPGLPVDTHVARVSNRIGLVAETDPVKIEAELCELLPPEDWTQFSHTLIFHGRRICKARKPLCSECAIRCDCQYFSTI